MGILFLVGMFACAALSLFLPWVGAVYAYLFVVLGPQDIWFWDFDGWRPQFWVLLFTSVGVILGIARRIFDLSILRNKRNLFILILWLCIVASYYLGPYTHIGGPYRWDNAEYALDKFNKIYLLYFVACLCIDSERKLKTMFYVFVGSALYLIYWANRQYLTGHYFGRLSGPVGAAGTGDYADQNNFAMLFVVSQSFLWYLGASFRQAVWRWLCWLSIPFCWHAVFLTGSRGGLLGLGATTLLISLRSKRRILGLALIPALIFVFFWQGGSVMKERANTIDQYHTSASAEGRLESWRAATRMIADNPLTGVGLASYGPAFPHYSDAQPHEAHDTFLQITAESGVAAGAMYVLIVLTCIVPLWKNGNRLKRDVAEGSGTLLMVNEATLIGFCGLIVCSLFLSLQRYEIFYSLNMMANTLLYLSNEKAPVESGDYSDGIPRSVDDTGDSYVATGIRMTMADSEQISVARASAGERKKLRHRLWVARCETGGPSEIARKSSSHVLLLLHLLHFPRSVRLQTAVHLILARIALTDL